LVYVERAARLRRLGKGCAASPDFPEEMAAVAATPSGDKKDESANRPSSTKAAEDKIKGPKVTRLQMIEFLNVREWWAKGQTGLCFTIVLWISFSFIVWNRTDVEAAFEVNSALINYIEETVAHPKLSKVPPLEKTQMPLPCTCACRSNLLGWPLGACGGIGNDGRTTEVLELTAMVPEHNATNLDVKAGGFDSAAMITWDDIESPDQLWYWARHGLIPALWTPRSGRSATERPGFLVRRNQLIGGVRVKQVRADVDDTCDLDDDLRRHYHRSCRLETPATESLDMTGVDPRFVNNSAANNAFSPSDSGTYDAMLDIELPMEDVAETMSLLTQYKWLDGMAREIEFTTVALNAEVGIYAYIQISFHFPFAGGVKKNVRVRLLQVVDISWEKIVDGQWVDFIPEVVWAVLIILLLRQELWQIGVMCYRKQFCEYVQDLWNYMDWISIVFGVPIFFYWYVIAFQTGDMTKAILDLRRAPLTDGDLVSHREAWNEISQAAEGILVIKYYHQMCLFWYTVILTFRFLKNFITQQKLATFELAFVHSLYDLWHFFLIFMTVLANFVLGGRILFGAELSAWSTLQQSAGSTVRMLMSNFDFEAMYEIAPISASLWFWLFILSMLFVFSNFLLAIIYDHWESFRKLIGPTPTVWQDIKENIKDFLWRCEWRRELIRDEEYRDAFNNPYEGNGDGLIAEILEVAKVDEEYEKATRSSSLGCKMVRRRLETYSMEGIENDGSEGGKILTQLEFRTMGADPYCAEHLLEECEKYVAKESAVKSHLEEVRNLSKLIRTCKVRLFEHCDQIEKGIDGERGNLWETLGELEYSLRESLDNFINLRTMGVDTLAPPLASQLRPVFGEIVLEPEQYKERMDIGDSEMGTPRSDQQDRAYELARKETEALRNAAARIEQPPPAIDN
jgi:hypothetical protein